MSTKSALIFGCLGQDGSLLSKSLIKQGFRVIGSQRSRSDNFKNLKKLGIASKMQLIKADIRKFEDVLEAIEYSLPDEIYCLAAQSSVGNSYKKPYNTLESNTLGTLNILEACKELNYKGRIYFAGSSEIFGHQISPINLETKVNPKSPYAISKYASQNLVTLYRESYGLEAMTGILFNHESPFRDKRFVTQKIITGALTSLKDKNHKIKIGNINIERDWGWAEEFIAAIQLITRADRISDYIICTGKKTSLEYFIKKTYDKLNLDWEDHVLIDEELFRPNDIQISWGNPDKLFNDLGWKATVFIDEIIDNLIEANINQL